MPMGMITQPVAPSVAAPVIAPVIGGGGPPEIRPAAVVQEDRPAAIMREAGNIVQNLGNIYLQQRAQDIESQKSRALVPAEYAPYATGQRTPVGPALDYAPDFIQPMSPQSGYQLSSPLLLGGGSNLISMPNSRRGSIASGGLLSNQNSVTPPVNVPPVNVGPPGSNMFTPGPPAKNNTTPKGPQTAPPVLGNQNTSQGGFFTNFKKRISNAVSPKDTTPPPVDTPSNKRSNTSSINNAVYGTNVSPPSSGSSLANNSQQMQNERFDEQEEKKQEERPRNMMSPVLENFLNQPALGYGSPPPVLGSQGAGYNVPNAPRVNKAGVGGAVGRYQEEEKKMEENPNLPEGPLLDAANRVKDMPREDLLKKFNIDDINNQISQFRSEIDAMKAKREEDEARRKEAEKKNRKEANLASATKQLRENARTNRALDYGMTPQELQEINELENIRNNPTRYQLALEDKKLKKALAEYIHGIKTKDMQARSKQFTSRYGTNRNPMIEVADR